MNMMEFHTSLLPTVITLMSLLLLGWQYRRREERKVAAVQVMKLNRFGTAGGSRNLDVFLPASYPEPDGERYHLMVLNAGRIEQVSMLQGRGQLEIGIGFDTAIEVIAVKKHD